MQFPSQILPMFTTRKTIDLEVKVTSIRRIHTFRKDCITQIINCKPWSPRLCPYPSLVQKMQNYLELKDPEANHPCSSLSEPDKPNTPSLQKAPIPRTLANKKQKRRNRSKQANRGQFKVRLIKKPLFSSSIATSPKPKAMTTTATVTQSTRTNPIITSFNVAHDQNHKGTTINLQCTQCKNSGDSQFPSAQTMAKTQGRERTPIPVHKISLMEQQPATLNPKTTATATSVILPVMSTPSRGPTPWSNTVLTSANLLIARSWPLPPNKGESPIPAMQEVIKIRSFKN